MAERREELATAYVSVCRQEVEALKPGNVHVFAAGHGMAVEHFLTSANVSAIPLTEPGAPLGRRVLGAIRATRDAVGLNTNLGIVLLCAPLLMAAESGDALRPSVRRVLAELTTDDANDAFAAIAHASPGGLGEADHDVREPPRIGLLDAMQLAADRDLVARQYVNGLADVFELGLAELDAARGRGETGMWPCVFAYFRFLAKFPDSHVARKHDADVAANVQTEALSIRGRLSTLRNDNERKSLLLEFDSSLKARNINPGTSADLTVASLLVRDLRDNLHIPVDDD